MKVEQEYTQEEALQLRRLGVENAWMARPWNVVNAPPPGDLKSSLKGRGVTSLTLRAKHTSISGLALCLTT